MGFNSGFKVINAKLNPICHLLALLGAHPILHISRLRVKGNYFFKSSLVSYRIFGKYLIIYTYLLSYPRRIFLNHPPQFNTAFVEKSVSTDVVSLKADGIRTSYDVTSGDKYVHIYLDRENKHIIKNILTSVIHDIFSLIIGRNIYDDNANAQGRTKILRQYCAYKEYFCLCFKV